MKQKQNQEMSQTTTNTIPLRPPFCWFPYIVQSDGLSLDLFSHLTAIACDLSVML